MTVYKKSLTTDLPRPLEPGPVLHWPETEKGKESVICSCPCGETEYWIARHNISFDAEGKLTIDPSILKEGYVLRTVENYNYRCHSFIRNGKFEMVGDSTCPGKDL